jgi:transcriptional regulator with XRE-family HTH domain
MTQVTLAHRVGVSSAQITNIEAGRRIPSVELILQVADLFGVSSDYLLRDTVPLEAAEEHQVKLTPAQTDVMPLFGQKVRHQRMRRGMTQAEMAHRLGLSSHAHVSNMETDRKDASLDLILQIADLFGVSTDYLLRDSIPVEAEGQDHGE